MDVELKPAAASSKYRKQFIDEFDGSVKLKLNSSSVFEAFVKNL
jgi:hypothetical protein